MTIVSLCLSRRNGWACLGLLGRVWVVLWKGRRRPLFYGWRD